MRIKVAVLLLVLVGMGLLLGGLQQSGMIAQDQDQDRPVLQVSPTSLSFQGQAGGPTPAPQYLTIANTGSELMEWHASADVDWIILGAEGGKLSGGRAIQLLVWVDIEGLEAGEYHGTVTISSPNAQGSPVEVEVTLTLSAPPRLEVTPTRLSFEAEEGGRDPEPQKIRIRNAGGGTLSWEASTDADWLRLGANRGSLIAGQSTEVLVLVKISGLEAGEYEGRIKISASSPQARVENSPVTVEVSLKLKEAVTYTVCTSGCRYSSLGLAIDGARSGEVITIGPGTYNENIEITRSLTLRGAGQGKTIIKGKEEGKPVILIESNSEIEVTIEGLTIAEAKVGEKKTWKEDGIWIGGKARAIIRNSLISGNGDDGISMEGSSQATISGSQISGNNWNGIWMGGSSQAEISGSQISGNGWDGIMMWESSQAEIRDSRFLDNGGCGIAIWGEEARVLGGPNEMRGNGADLCGYAPASLRRPLVPQTERIKLSVPGDYPSIQEAIDAIAPGGTITVAPGTYEVGLTLWKPLTLRGAGKEETVLKPLPNPTHRLIVSIISEAEGANLEGLAITGSKGDGLLISGKASLKDLKILGNGDDGIDMQASSQTEISDSEISGNGDDGIFMWDSSQATISGSQISENGWNGITVADSSQATISDLQISGNRSDGIWIGDSSQATISGSQISENGWNGILMKDSSQATIRDNEIFENKGYGVALDQRPCFDTPSKFEGKVEGSGNEIRDNGKGDVCPSELEFLTTSRGGCYGPEC